MCIEAKIVNVFTKGGAVNRASVVSHFMEELSNDHVVRAERAFSSQNCLITDLKTRMSTNNHLSMKILIQSLSRLLPSNILEELLKEAASNYCSEINRRKGAGSL